MYKRQVEALLVGYEVVFQNLGKVVIDRSPYVDDLIVTLVVGDKTGIVVGHDLVHALDVYKRQLSVALREAVAPKKVY